MSLGVDLSVSTVYFNYFQVSTNGTLDFATQRNAQRDVTNLCWEVVQRTREMGGRMAACALRRDLM